jgi:type IV secretory pathway VirB10-like protein
MEDKKEEVRVSSVGSTTRGTADERKRVQDERLRAALVERDRFRKAVIMALMFAEQQAEPAQGETQQPPADDDKAKEEEEEKDEEEKNESKEDVVAPAAGPPPKRAAPPPPPRSAKSLQAPTPTPEPTAAQEAEATAPVAVATTSADDKKSCDGSGDDAAPVVTAPRVSWLASTPSTPLLAVPPGASSFSPSSPRSPRSPRLAQQHQQLSPRSFSPSSPSSSPLSTSPSGPGLVKPFTLSTPAAEPPASHSLKTLPPIIGKRK